MSHPITITVHTTGGQSFGTDPMPYREADEFYRAVTADLARGELGRIKVREGDYRTLIAAQHVTAVTFEGEVPSE